jgi:hypothetical protein
VIVGYAEAVPIESTDERVSVQAARISSWAYRSAVDVDAAALDVG